MTDKDPKDMTVSEQLRWAANGEPYNGIDENIWTYPTGKIRALAEAVTGEWPSDNEIFSIVADKIDAEIVKAYSEKLNTCAMRWAKANGWPDFKDGEDFGAWLDRCAIPRPRFEDGEIVAVGEYEDILGYCVYDDGEFSLTTPDRSIDFASGERVKRPAPEVLGADGLPLKVGDTVWHEDGSKLRIIEVTNKTQDNGVGTEWMVRVEDLSNASLVWSEVCPMSITHTPPDTQERIDEDALKSCVQYWGCNGFNCGKCPALIDGKKPVEFYELDPIHDSCHEAQRLNLLRRQRELDARKGGAE